MESLQTLDTNKRSFEEPMVAQSGDSSSIKARKSSFRTDTGAVFDMENMMVQNDLNAVDELDETNGDDSGGSGLAGGGELIFEASPVSPKSTSAKTRFGSSLKTVSNIQRMGASFSDETSIMSVPSDANKYIDLGMMHPSSSSSKNLDETSAHIADAVFECDRASLSEASKQTNISTTAFNSFVRIIGSLGPVLTCKYCCTDLLKMLAICYMNSKCLSVIETTGDF